jgi:hypothetical protein
METAKVITLNGNKNNPESAEHIIKFPGGSISVCRTSNDEYWAHITVNKRDVLPETVEQSKVGEIIHSRLDYVFPNEEIKQIPDIHKLYHLAVRIITK